MKIYETPWSRKRIKHLWNDSVGWVAESLGLSFNIFQRQCVRWTCRYKYYSTSCAARGCAETCSKSLQGSLRSECNILASSVLECGRQPVFYDLFVESRRIFHDFVGGRQGISNKEESTQEKLCDQRWQSPRAIYRTAPKQGRFQTPINTW